VPSGAAVSPGGAQGLAGTPAWTTCTSSFTIPAVGSTVSVPVVDTSWITTGEMIYVDQAGSGVGLSGILQVTAKAGNTLTLLNPTPAPAIPPADTTQAGLLKQLSGNTTDFVDGTNTCQNLVNAIQPTIWSARLRSFNAIGNPTFEVDQRQVNGTSNYPAGSSSQFQCDRWAVQKNAATAVFTGQTFVAPVTGGTNVPGTNFRISRSYIQLSVSTPQATLAAGEYLFINQAIEGPRWRELASDVHSISILCYCSIALNFSVALIDSANAYSLVIPCSIPANTMTLVTLPNLPVWSSSGTFSQAPGSAPYLFRICLGTGTTYQAPTTGSWISGNYLGS